MFSNKRKTILLILGSGLYGLYEQGFARKLSIETRYGKSEVLELKGEERCHTYVMMRHGPNHSIPPHMINYRANIASARELHADYIIATASVGAISTRLRVGTYVVMDQFIDFTRRVGTFFTEPHVEFYHIDMTHPYSEKVRRALLSSLKKEKIEEYSSSGTYLCTEGPRFETPAEIKMYRKLGGDIIGMTGVPEVILANELGIEYGGIALITNKAAGLQKSVSQEEVDRTMSRFRIQMKAILDNAIGELAKN